MPFSFKPDILQGNTQPAQVAPGAAPSALPANLMERSKSEGASFIEILLFALFGFAAMVTVVLFVYKFYLTSQIENKKARLDVYDKQLEGIPLDDMKKLSGRLKITNQLVKEHPSVNVAFLILEASIEHMITFNNFDLRYTESSNGYQLTLNGSAPDYKSVAQQMDTYKRDPYNKYVSSVTVDGLNPNPAGRIVFGFKMPISITGLIPETFSIVDGEAVTPAPLEVSTTTAATAATTTLGMGIENASSTAQVTTP